MKKALLVSAAALLASAVAYGGQINLGYTLGGQNYGLIGTQTVPPANGNLPNGAGYITTTTRMAKVDYDEYLFQEATYHGGSVAIPTATSVAQNIVTDSNGNTFALMGGNDVSETLGSSQTGTVNAWYSSATGLNGASIYVPVGTLGVTSVSTLLNDNTGSNVTVTFDFSTQATGDNLNNPIAVALHLVDGVDIDSAVNCGTPGTSPGCAANMYTTTSAGSVGTAVAASNLPNSLTTINVQTGSIAVGPYDSIVTIANGNPYGVAGGSTGTLSLGSQTFNFGYLFANDYLVGITLSEPGGSPGNFALSAVTVTATPEPASLGLGLTGLILMGAGLIRRKRVA